MTSSIDALLLCGDKGASKPIYGESKAFLFLHGTPLFMHVLKALDGVSRVKRVFIVGNKEKLDHHLGKSGGSSAISKPVVVLDQGKSLVANIWDGFLATLDGYETGAEKNNHTYQEKMILMLPGDSPLLSPDEINDFIDRANMEKYDYVAGITDNATMRRYHSADGKPGINMAYMQLREGAFRVNNLHLARPFACSNKDAIQRLYNSRYQKDLGNIIRLTKDMWVNHVKLQSLVLYFTMQISMLLAFLRLKRLNHFFRQFSPLKSATTTAGDILGMRCGVAVTRRGGAALDVDNEIDYETMKLRFNEWKKLQKTEYTDTLLEI